MRVQHKYSRIELFLVGKVESLPLEETPLLYALLRVGKVERDDDHEWMGLYLSTAVSPTFCKKVAGLSSPENDVREIISSNDLSVMLGKLPTYQEESHPDHFVGGRVRRIAILVPIKMIRKLKSSMDEGLPVAVERKNILEICSRGRKRLKEQSRELKMSSQEIHRRIKKAVATREKLLKNPLPAISGSVNADGLSIALHYEQELIEFLASAVSKFGDDLKRERLRLLREANKKRYNICRKPASIK